MHMTRRRRSRYSREKNEKLQKFITWLKDNGAEFPNLHFKEYNKNERGVHTKRSIDKGAMAVKIPKELLIYAEMGADTPWGKKMRDHNIVLNDPKMIDILLYMLVAMKDPTNFFRPYFDILPKSMAHFPMFWQPSELEFLEQSSLINRIHERRNRFKKDYNSIANSCPEFKDECSLDRFIKLRSIIGSRNFGLVIDGKRQPAMVPFGDMLNHDIPADVSWTFDPTEDAFCMTTTRRVPGGTQVTDSYGNKLNSDYLLFYGFTVDDNNSRRDTIKIRLMLPEQDALYISKKGLISDFLDVTFYKDVGDITFQNAMYYLRIANANSEELQQFLDNPELARQPFNRRNEMAALAFLGWAARKKQETYPTSLRQNIRSLKQMKPYSNKTFATRLVIGEKEVIQFLTDLVELGLSTLVHGKRSSSRNTERTTNNYITKLREISL